jgi:hypothetical protein
MQILEDQAEYVLRIEGYKRKRPNSPGSSKRKHFDRANQKRGKQDFTWSPPQDSQKKNPRGPVKGCPEGRHHEEGDESRFTWTAPDTEPHVEPPRPKGWKPLKLTPETVKKIADQRLSEWSKDQEEYAEQQFQIVEQRKRELKTQAKEARKAESSDEEETQEQREANARAAKEQYRRCELMMWKNRIWEKYHPDLKGYYEEKRKLEGKLSICYQGEKYEKMQDFLENRRDWQRSKTFQEEMILKLETARDREFERTERELQTKWFKEDHGDDFLPPELKQKEENPVVLKVQEEVEARRKEEREEEARRLALIT